MIGTAFGLLARHMVPALIVLAGLAAAMIAGLLLMPFFGFLGFLLALFAYAGLADYWFRSVHGRMAPGEDAPRLLYMGWTLIKIHLLLYLPLLLILPFAFGRMFFMDPAEMGENTIGVFMMGLMQGFMWLFILLPLWLWIYLRLSLALAASALEGPTSLREAWARTRGLGGELVLPVLLILGVAVLMVPVMLLTGPVVGPAALGVLALALTSALYMRAGASVPRQP